MSRRWSWTPWHSIFVVDVLVVVIIVGVVVGVGVFGGVVVVSLG